MTEIVIEIRAFDGLPDVFGTLEGISWQLNVGGYVVQPHREVLLTMPQDLACFALKQMGSNLIFGMRES